MGAWVGMGLFMVCYILLWFVGGEGKKEKIRDQCVSFDVQEIFV